MMMENEFLLEITVEQMDLLLEWILNIYLRKFYRLDRMFFLLRLKYHEYGANRHV